MVVFLSSLRSYLERVLAWSDGRGHSLQEEAGHLKNHVRNLEEGLREATANLERSCDLETRLLTTNRALQEYSVECEQLKEENRRLREELNVTRATVRFSCVHVCTCVCVYVCVCVCACVCMCDLGRGTGASFVLRAQLICHAFHSLTAPTHNSSTCYHLLLLHVMGGYAVGNY